MLTHANALTPPAPASIFNRTKVCTRIALYRTSTISRVACACISKSRKAASPDRRRARQSRIGLGRPDSNIMHSPATPPQHPHGTLAATSGLPPQSTSAVWLLVCSRRNKNEVVKLWPHTNACMLSSARHPPSKTHWKVHKLPQKIKQVY